MTKANSTKKALLSSAFALLVCVAMLIGTTFAWFTDTASTAVNKIQAGTLKVDIVDLDGNSLKNQQLKWQSKDGREQADILWEPGCTYYLEPFMIQNKGNLALKYKVIVNGVTGDDKLLEALDFGFYYFSPGFGYAKSLDELVEGGNLDNVSEYPDLCTAPIYIYAHMKETAGNEYQDLSIEGIGITVVATQYTYEKDSTGDQYDKDATYPEYTVTDAADLTKAAKEGGIITVDNDIAPSRAVVANGTVQLDMNGKTLKNTENIWGDDADQWSLVSAQNGANLTISGNGKFAAKADDCYAVDVQDGSTVTIKNGTFTGNIHAVYVLEGTAIIEGGFYSVQQKYPDATKADEFVLNCYDQSRKDGTAKIVVKGGTFVNFNPADCAAEGEHTNFVADGYKVVSETQANGDIWYTVVAE